MKHVGITDSARERLKMSVKTLAIGFVNVDMFKGLAHIGYGERDHTVVRNS